MDALRVLSNQSMEGVGLSTFVFFFLRMLTFLFLGLVRGLVHKQLEGSFEDVWCFARARLLILVEIKCSQDHVRKHIVLNLISLLYGNKLEVLLVVYYCEHVVPGVTFNKLRSLVIHFRSLSSVTSTKLLQGIIFNTCDSKSKFRVDFTGVPNFLIITG